MNIMYANIMEDRDPEFEKSGILLGTAHTDKYFNGRGNELMKSIILDAPFHQLTSRCGSALLCHRSRNHPLYSILSVGSLPCLNRKTTSKHRHNSLLIIQMHEYLTETHLIDVISGVFHIPRNGDRSHRHNESRDDFFTISDVLT